MNKTGFFCRAVALVFLLFVVATIGAPAVFAQGGDVEAQERALAQSRGAWHYLGAAVGLGLIVIGAATGIGKFTAAAAEGIARQPAAAAQISGAVTLPLFLLEGVAILAEVFVLLIVLLK